MVVSYRTLDRYTGKAQIILVFKYSDGLLIYINICHICILDYFVLLDVYIKIV